MSTEGGREALITELEGGGDHLVLRRLDLHCGLTGVPNHGGLIRTAVILDVETTGLDVDVDCVIELAMRRFKFDENGRIVELGKSFLWREDPGRPLNSSIKKLTGLTDADLSGQRIDEKVATDVIRSVDLVVAHNASFDRKFVERRLPGAAGQAWACSCREIDWCAAGFDGRALGWLTAQAGWFFDAHRAQNDVDAVVALLGHVTPDGRTALAQLLENSARESFRIEAVGASFEVKDRLRERGYRWDAGIKSWWTEVAVDDRAAEVKWLEEAVYRPEWRPKEWEPREVPITAFERHR